MGERPYSRYTREKTWAALHSQHINAGYALVPFSATNNSIDVIRCASPSETQTLQRSLNDHADNYRVLYDHDQLPGTLSDEVNAVREKKRVAVVLAKSSDYYRYHLSEIKELRIVICGLHDSYLHLTAWETRTNQRFKARETAIPLTSPVFDQARRTQFGHAILVGALHNGDKDAQSFMEGLKKRSERSYWRIKAEVDAMQDGHYRGRPLAFLTEAERKEIGSKISDGLKRYHANRRLRIV